MDSGVPVQAKSGLREQYPNSVHVLCPEIALFGSMEESMIIDLGSDPDDYLSNGHYDEDDSN